MKTKLNRYVHYVFILSIVSLMIVLAIWFPSPTEFQYIIFKTFLALSVAGIVAMLPGQIAILGWMEPLWIKITGAGAIFALVYFFNPASLVSVPVLSEDDLTGKSPLTLDIMRNEPFALHGRRFCRRDLQEYFNNQDWYNPRYCPDKFDKFNHKSLTPTQNYNVDLIDEYQKKKGLLNPRPTSEVCRDNLPDCYE